MYKWKMMASQRRGKIKETEQKEASVMSRFLYGPLQHLACLDLTLSQPVCVSTRGQGDVLCNLLLPLGHHVASAPPSWYTYINTHTQQKMCQCWFWKRSSVHDTRVQISAECRCKVNQLKQHKQILLQKEELFLFICIFYLTPLWNQALKALKRL